jgi:transcriptional regulator with XRE-family HTH domain
MEEAAEAFAAELAYWREVRGFSKKKLASTMGFDPSYVSHIESGRHPPTEDFTTRAEKTLNSGQALWRRWQEYEAARHTKRRQAERREPRVTGQLNAPGTGLIVEHDDAYLRYTEAVYHLTMRRLLINAGNEPITRFLMRISVDRYPSEPERSNQLYREHPLTWGELNLTARCGTEEMAWQAKHDRDAFKEVWLLFENAHGRFPLYPGEQVWIEYSYTVGNDKWGTWFQRAVRLPTKHLSVQLAFPAELEPLVWGTETSMTADCYLLRTPIASRYEENQHLFTWATEGPSLHARYRLEWRFRASQILNGEEQ